MERKTIGGLIAALRKASGMTQKDLAEKLNVSDKSVSRWERDDGAPDLSLIPVIAEIFGVTCDELLRGERKSPHSRKKPPKMSPLSAVKNSGFDCWRWPFPNTKPAPPSPSVWRWQVCWRPWLAI